MRQQLEQNQSSKKPCGAAAPTCHSVQIGHNNLRNIVANMNDGSTCTVSVYFLPSLASLPGMLRFLQRDYQDPRRTSRRGSYSGLCQADRPPRLLRAPEDRPVESVYHHCLYRGLAWLAGHVGRLRFHYMRFKSFSSRQCPFRRRQQLLP